MWLSSTNATRFDNPYTQTESIVLVVSMLLIIAGSFVGSVVMIAVMLRNNQMWTSTNILIGNLAISGLLLTVFTMPAAVFTPLTGRWEFGDGLLCQMGGFTCSLLLLTSIFTHAMISVDKYFAVVKPLSRAMTVKRTYVVIFSVWFVAALISTLPLLGIGLYEYNRTTLVCGVGFPRNKLDAVVLELLALFGFAVPIFTMTFVYIRIYSAVKQHKARLLRHGMVNHLMIRLQRRLIATVLLSLVCFLLCWMPFCCLTLLGATLKDRNKIPTGLGAAAYWCGYFNSFVNPIIICTMNRRFREGFIALWRRPVGFVLSAIKCSCLFPNKKICSGPASPLDTVALATRAEGQYNTFQL